jgi:hypothetical protein
MRRQRMQLETSAHCPRMSLRQFPPDAQLPNPEPYIIVEAQRPPYMECSKHRRLVEILHCLLHRGLLFTYGSHTKPQAYHVLPAVLANPIDAFRKIQNPDLDMAQARHSSCTWGQVRSCSSQPTSRDSLLVQLSHGYGRIVAREVCFYTEE